MVFSSPTFICLFLPLVLAIYCLLPRWMNNAVLVVASLVFYAWADPVAALLLIIPSVVINFHFGKLIGASSGCSRGLRLTVSLAFNLIILIVFKYSYFITENFNLFLTSIGFQALPEPRLTLPLGISFFTFHLISYLVDVYRGLFPPQRSFLAFALYIVNFSQLIAGPIIRYRLMVHQLGARTVMLGDLEYGVMRFTTGLGKKLLIADPVGQLADAVFGVPASDLTTGAAWLGLICYSLQIYFDFSGYSDMAIGLARMFGFRFPENFNYPYAATSIQDFWRRWHITLSAWFRDYVYIPLGGNRYGSWTTTRNLWIVFLLAGAWHGASWNFIVWGLWHGLFLALERLAFVARMLGATPSVLRQLYALSIVAIGWVFFRSPDLAYAMEFLERMFALTRPIQDPIAISSVVTMHSLIVLGIVFAFAQPLWPWLRERWVPAQDSGHRQAFLSFAATGYVAAIMLLSFAALVSQENSPFLYFRF